MKIERIKGLIRTAFPEPKYTRLRNTAIYDWMNRNAKDKRVLNLGSGVGSFDGNLDTDIRMVNLDICHGKPNLTLIGDAHTLPFKDGSFDIVYSIAVLEHVKRPWIVAQEITRVLAPGGHVVVELPFLNTIHDEHDYFRFTDKGIRSLFDESNYDVTFQQVGSGGGSFLSVFLLQYFQQFFPGRLLPLIWRFLMRYPFASIKYLDVFIDKSPELRMTANSFSFIGRKR